MRAPEPILKNDLGIAFPAIHQRLSTGHFGHTIENDPGRHRGTVRGLVVRPSTANMPSSMRTTPRTRGNPR